MKQKERTIESGTSQSRNLRIAGYSAERRKLSAAHLRKLREERIPAGKKVNGGDFIDSPSHLTLERLTEELYDAIDPEGMSEKPPISKRQLSSYEHHNENANGSASGINMTAKNIVALADFYHVSSDYILGLTDINYFDEEITTLGRRVGLSENAVRVLAAIHDNGMINLINQLLDNSHIHSLLSYIESCRASSERIQRIDDPSLIKEGNMILAEFMIFIFGYNYKNKDDPTARKLSADCLALQMFLSENPQHTEFFDKFPFISTPLIFGGDYIAYLKHTCMDIFSRMLDEITGADAAMNISMYGIDDEYDITKHKKESLERLAEDDADATREMMEDEEAE